eukprot:1508565-Pyramimonas_sp.AAC.1
MSAGRHPLHLLRRVLMLRLHDDVVGKLPQPGPDEFGLLLVPLAAGKGAPQLRQSLGPLGSPAAEHTVVHVLADDPAQVARPGRSKGLCSLAVDDTVVVEVELHGVADILEQQQHARAHGMLHETQLLDQELAE